MIEGLPALYIFMLSAFTGYEVISRVPVILHTPLMSGANAISGITVVGAISLAGTGQQDLANWLGAGAVLAILVVFYLAVYFDQPTSTSDKEGAIDSIAVLPLFNLSLKLLDTS